MRRRGNSQTLGGDTLIRKNTDFQSDHVSIRYSMLTGQNIMPILRLFFKCVSMSTGLLAQFPKTYINRIDAYTISFFHQLAA